MYVCMYVRMYVCMYVCMYICMYVCMYVCMYHASRYSLSGNVDKIRLVTQVFVYVCVFENCALIIAFTACLNLLSPF